jgi:hypothetical protein
MPDLSEPQRRTLREIEAGRVQWSISGFRFRSLTFPPSVRSDVVQRLVDARLACVGAQTMGAADLYHVVLTDAGRAALARETGR